MTFDFSNIDLKQGLTQKNWEALESCLKNSADPALWIQDMNRQFPLLAEKALEAGMSSLAALLVCPNPLMQIRALLISGQKNSALSYLSTVQDSSLKVFCEVIYERTQGQSLKVFEKYLNQVSDLFQNLSRDEEIEARMQWAQLLYTLEKWDQVLVQYKLAFELCEQEKKIGSGAICAFNLATVHANLNQKIEAKTWLWMAQKNLSVYTLENLQNSLELYEIQLALKDLQDEQVIRMAPEYLKKTNLSLMQRVRALHSLAESQTELGQILDAKVTLSLSRKIIHQGQYNQYMKAQEILEMNLNVVTHRPLRFSISKIAENSGLNSYYRAAQARWHFRMNDQGKTLRLAAEIKNESAQMEDFDDLFVLLSNRLEQPGKRARTIESQIYKCWLTKQWRGLEYLKTFLEIEKSTAPWKRTLFFLISGVLNLIQLEVTDSYTNLKTGLKIARENGLERLETLILSLLKTLHGESSGQGSELLPEELAFYESLLSKLSAQPVSVSRNEKGQVGFGSENSDLIYDEDKAEMIWQNETISLQNQPILQRILKQLMAQAKGLSKEQLAESVWGLEYHPFRHDAMIYSAMGRLRDLIPIESVDGLYRLPRTISWTQLSQNKKNSLDLTDRQKLIMEKIEMNSTLSRKETVEMLIVSERTALRELTQLVRMGLITQAGAGRGSHYQKWNQGA